MEKKSDYLTRNMLLIFHVYLAIFAITVTTLLVFKFYTYQVSATPEVRPYVLESIKGNALTSSVAREGQERMAYVASIFCASLTVFLSIFLSLFLSKKISISKKTKESLYQILIIISTFLTFITAEFSIYMASGILISSDQKIELYSSSFTIILTLAIFLGATIYGCFASKLLERKMAVIFAIFSIIISIFISSYAIFDEYQIYSSSVNFDAVVFPIIQTYLGKILLIDFKTLYGLYPNFLQIFLHIFPANILTLSLVLGSLLLISYLSIAFCLFHSVKNKLVALLGFIAVIYMQNFANDLWPNPIHLTFQYEPIRLLFPSLLLGFLCIFFKKPSEVKYYSGLAFFSYSTFWNLDTGMPTFLTLLIMLGYYKAFMEKKDGTFIKKNVLHLASSIGILAFLWLSFFLFLKIKYGQFPEISWLTYGQNAAFKIGYVMFPIKPIGIWYIPVLVYIIGYVISIYNFFTKQFSLQNNLILALTLLGNGLFIYYIGRSHEYNVLHCGYPSMMLLTIFADKFCGSFAKKDFKFFLPKPRMESLLFGFPLLIISFLSAAFLFNLFSFEPLKKIFISEKFAKKPDANEAHWVSEAAFIKDHIGGSFDEPRDDILMLSIDWYEYYFALELKAKFPLNFINLHHIFYVQEMNDLYQLIISQKTKWVVFIEPKFLKINSSLSLEEIAYLKKLLLNNYKISSGLKVNEYENLTIYEKL